MANLIKDVIVGSNVSFVDFTDLTIEKGELYKLVISLTANPSGEAFPIFCDQNGTLITAGSSYYFQMLQAISTSVSGVRINAPNTSNLNGGQRATFVIWLKLTNDGHFVLMSNSNMTIPTTPVIRNHVITSTFTTNSITKLRLGGGSVGAGTRIQLYKVAEKVVDIEVTGSAVTQIDIDQLDNGDDLFIERGNEYLLVSDILNATGSGANYRLFINDDLTTTNYDRQRLTADSTTVSGFRENNSYLQNAGANGKTLTVTNLKLPNSGLFNAQNKGVSGYGGSSIRFYNSIMSRRLTASFITKLSIKGDLSNSIDVGSRFELYKLI